MVYCGVPSKACAECRLRRTKCDTLKPSCSQCKRAGRTCTGYRDPTDLRFRDESQGLRIKRQRQKESQKAASTTSSQCPAKAEDVSRSSKALTIPLSQVSAHALPKTTPFLFDLGTSAEEQATCFFFKNYVFQDYKFQSRCDLQYLLNIYSSEEIGPALSESVVSLGMAGLSHFWRASSLMGQANAKYNSALQIVSSRLRNLEEAKTDQTLASVLLLGLYETITCNTRQSMDSWTKHISGATALLVLRGKQQLSTPVGREMFTNLRTQVIVDCVQGHRKVPPIISEWNKACQDYETPEEFAASNLTELAIKYTAIRSSLSSFHDYSNSETVIPALIALDAEYTEWISHLPTEFLFTTVPLIERSDEVFSDHYHVYPSMWVARVWNNYRCIRILINELILDQLNHHFLHPGESTIMWENPSLYESQILASNSMLLQLSHDICASAPYFLGFSNSIDPVLRERPKAASGNMLLWPLYSAAVTQMVSPMMRDWVAGRLRMIAEDMGIKQAAPLAYFLMQNRDHSEWKDEIVDTVMREHSSASNSPTSTPSSIGTF